MANRTFMDKQYTMVKRRVELYAAVLGAGAAAPSLRKWNYPTLGTGPNARTYTAAPTANALPTGAAYPLQYACGAEGVRSVTRTGVGLWTVQLQDNYQRVLMVSATTDVAGGLGTILQVSLNTTITNMASAGGSTIGLALLSATGTAADPAVGAIILLKLDLADATEP
jgi:hypothetical protein